VNDVCDPPALFCVAAVLLSVDELTVNVPVVPPDVTVNVAEAVLP